MSIIAEALKRVERSRIHSDHSKPLEPRRKPSDDVVMQNNAGPKKIVQPFALAAAFAAIVFLGGWFLTHKSNALSTAPGRTISAPLAGKEALPQVEKKTLTLGDAHDIPTLSLLTRPGPNLVLNGIVSGYGEPIAVINNRVLWRGDSINGATVREITPTKVTLFKDGRDSFLELGK